MNELDRPFRFFLILIFAVISISSCATYKKLSYKNEEIRKIVSDKSQNITVKNVIVPFEVTEEQIAAVREYTKTAKTDLERAEMLLKAITDPEKLGIRWSELETKTAAETIRTKSGNCISVASVFVGLARALGLNAYYSEALTTPIESVTESNFIVKSGHITGIIELADGRAALDIGDQLGFFTLFIKVSDIEATAHFYNNIGFEKIHEAVLKGEAPDWALAAKQFKTATMIAPDLESSWNNLGIAYFHLGKYEDALACYQRAIEENSEYSTPYTNLGILNQLRGNIDGSIKCFNKAIELDPQSTSTRLRLAYALKQKGQMAKAMSVLKNALAIQKDSEEACFLIKRISHNLGYGINKICPQSKSARPLEKSFIYSQ